MVSRSRLFFIALVLSLAVQRLLELRLSRRHEQQIRAYGGREHGAAHFPWMKRLHTAWFLAMLAEVFGLRRRFRAGVALGALLLFLIGQGLRYAAILTLGPRWTVRVMTLPGAPPVDRGIYRYVRHPNYLGVVLEILAVPLVHGAYLTALLFTVANAIILWIRIRAEERALADDSGYQAVFEQRPRFIPVRPRAGSGR